MKHKLTVYVEGTAVEMAMQLTAMAQALIPSGKVAGEAPVAPPAAAKTKPAKSTKSTKVEEEEEEFDLEGESDEVDGEEDDSGDEESEDADGEEEESEDEGEEEDGEEESKITLDDLVTASQKYAKKHGREKAVELLTKKFKVKGIRMLKPNQFEAALAALKK